MKRDNKRQKNFTLNSFIDVLVNVMQSVLWRKKSNFWFHLFTSSLHASSYLCWPFVYTVHHNSTWLEYLKSQSASQNTIQSILYRNYILLKNSLDFLWIDLWCEANVNKKFNKTLLKLWCKTILNCCLTSNRLYRPRLKSLNFNAIIGLGLHVFVRRKGRRHPLITSIYVSPLSALTMSWEKLGWKLCGQ